MFCGAGLPLMNNHASHDQARRGRIRDSREPSALPDVKPWAFGLHRKAGISCTLALDPGSGK